MPDTEPTIRNISDTALWVAEYRARETERPNAHFRDPFARRLAGERGAKIADAMPPRTAQEWPFTARTYLIDQFVAEAVSQGADTVINLAAGLDARPYRMDLPASLKWIEVDLPPLLDYKEEILKGETPRCQLERLRINLADVAKRREAFGQIGAASKRAVVISEGLIVYLDREEVISLAQDLASIPSFRQWIVDITSPGLLRMLQASLGPHLEGAGAPMKFGPKEGPHFFEPYGWKPTAVKGLMKTAGQLRRLPLIMRLFALLPDTKGWEGSRPWGGVCRLEHG